MSKFHLQWRGEDVSTLDMQEGYLPWGVRCHFVIKEPLYVEVMYVKDHFTFDGSVLNVTGDDEYKDRPVYMKVMTAPEEEVRKTA